MKLSKVLMGTSDARGPRGRLSRGNPVYRGGSNAPVIGKRIKQPQISLQEAARKRMMGKRNGN